MSYSRSPRSRSGSRGPSYSRSPSRGRKRNHSPAPRSRGGRGRGDYEEGTQGTGQISSLNERGFGFINSLDDGNGEEIYFHCTALGRQYPFDDLREGDEVEYEYIMDHKKNKPRAKSVRFVRAGKGGRSRRRGRSRSTSRSYERDRHSRRSGGYGGRGGYDNRY